MREFDLLVPTDLSRALEMLGSNNADIRPLAGGTDMIVDLRAARATPSTLVSLQNVKELQGVSRRNGFIRIGAATTIAEFLKTPLLTEYTALCQAARVFANPMIRNTATIAGNISSASPAGDMLPPLLALDAQIELASKSGTRKLPLNDFFLGPRKTARRADELVVGVQLHSHNPQSHTSSRFYKLALRQADAISLVSVAVWLERDGEQISELRIALGAVAPRPIRAIGAEKILRGQIPTSALILQVATHAAEESSPIDDLRASATYRRRMVAVYVRRMLEQAWEETK
jgi:CO/xanthine dehydrogenase FAD-binding subunit